MKYDSVALMLFLPCRVSSASQMTAAKVMDVTASIPGCAGQAADAVSAYTHVNHGGCSQISQNSEVRMSRHMETSSTTNGKNLGRPLKIEWFFLNEICTVTPLAGLLWERQFEERLLELGWEKIPNWECLFVHRKQGLLLSVYVDDI